MIDSADYTPDGKFLVLRDSFSKHESDRKVPVSLLDELIERRLSSYELEQLLLVRRETSGREYRKAPISELVNEDLTGKTVGIYDRNYENSAWLSSENIISVENNSDGMFAFTFTSELAKCWDGECEHHVADSGDDDCRYDSLQGVLFYGNETVLVSAKEVAA